MTERLTRDVVAAATRPCRAASSRVTLVMNACLPGERSYERPDVGHGAFSHWIIEGLKGEAWTDEGLEGGQLCRYVESSLAGWAQRTGLPQHADFQQLESASRVWLANAKPPRSQQSPTGEMPLPPLQPAQAAMLRLGKETTLPLQLVARGELPMGAADADAVAFSNERPRHRVRITRDFLISRRPVTSMEWDVVMGGGERTRREHGVDSLKTRVSWDDAQAFIVRLNELLADGRCTLNGGADSWTARLPTEAEWEYAVSIIHQDTCPDWIGLCWQWCEDWYGPYRYGLAVDPQGPREGTERILRGGSHEADARFLRPAARGHRPPDTRQEDIGFRIILVRGTHD